MKEKILLRFFLTNLLENQNWIHRKIEMPFSDFSCLTYVRNLKNLFLFCDEFNFINPRRAQFRDFSYWPDLWTIGGKKFWDSFCERARVNPVVIIFGIFLYLFFCKFCEKVRLSAFSGIFKNPFFLLVKFENLVSFRGRDLVSFRGRDPNILIHY